MQRLHFLRMSDNPYEAILKIIIPSLEKFQDPNALKEVIFGEKHAHYEHIYGHEHHEHLVCIGCGKIIEFTDERIDEFQGKRGLSVSVRLEKSQLSARKVGTIGPHFEAGFT